MNVFDDATLIGAGLVGPQIGVVLAQGTGRLRIYDQNPANVKRALGDMRSYIDELAAEGMLNGDPVDVFSRIEPVDSLAAAVDGVEFIVEAIFENREAKEALFSQLGGLTDPETIIASNTSGIPIRHMADVCTHPGRVVGSHFVLPAHILPLVEVIKHPKVDEAAIATTRRAWEKLGKSPITVNVDIPGFVANRLQHSLTRQAIDLFVNGIASAEDIDNAVRYGFGARFISVGPLGGRDLGGIINHSKVASYLYAQLFEQDNVAAETLAKMAGEGKDGVRAGQGFHTWDGDANKLRDFHYAEMIALVKRMNELGGIITNESDIPTT